MSNTKNIFEFLSDDEGSDNERPQKNNGEKRVRTRGKKTAPVSQPIESKSNNQVIDGRSRKEIDTKHQKTYQRNQGVPASHEGKDRHSGTGQSGVRRNNYRKDGAGKGNVGTIKDERRRGDEVQEQEAEEVEEQEEEVVDNTKTLEEYFENQGKDLTDVLDQQQEERKAGKIDQAQLKKDKLELVSKKPEIQSNVTQRNAKKVNYRPAYSGDASELINVRTGFVPEKKQERKPRQEQQPQQEATTENKEEATEGQEQRKPRENRDNRNNNRDQKPRDNRNNNRDNRNNNRDNRGNNNRDNNRSQKSKGFQQSSEGDFPKLG